MLSWCQRIQALALIANHRPTGSQPDCTHAKPSPSLVLPLAGLAGALVVSCLSHHSPSELSSSFYATTDPGAAAAPRFCLQSDPLADPINSDPQTALLPSLAP